MAVLSVGCVALVDVFSETVCFVEEPFDGKKIVKGIFLKCMNEILFKRHCSNS